MISQGLDLVLDLWDQNFHLFSVPALIKNQRSIKSECRLTDFINYLLDTYVKYISSIDSFNLSTVMWYLVIFFHLRKKDEGNAQDPIVRVYISGRVRVQIKVI